jgi:hypothetical protein
MTARPFVTVGTAAETTISITRGMASSIRPQGLVLDADHPLEVAGTRAGRIVLWADRAPEQTTVVTTDAGEIRIWHVWRDGDLIQAWQPGSSMIVDDDGDDLGLSCHDGHGADGVDLDVRLSFDRAWTQPGDADHDDTSDGESS